MLSYNKFLIEKKLLFPAEKTGAIVNGPLKIIVKRDPKEDSVYRAYVGRKLVGAAITTNDTTHGKFSIHRSATHPDYQKLGVMRTIYNSIEKTTGKQLFPSSALSDEGYQFWNKFRPEAVQDDLRKQSEKLLNKEYTHEKYGTGIINRIGAVSARVTKPNGNTFNVSAEKLKELGYIDA